MFSTMIGNYKFYYAESDGIGRLTVYLKDEKIYHGIGSSLCPTYEGAIPNPTNDDIKYWASVADVPVSEQQISQRRPVPQKTNSEEMSFITARNECV